MSTKNIKFDNDGIQSLFHSIPPLGTPADESALMYEYSLSQNNTTNIESALVYQRGGYYTTLFSLFTQTPNST